MVRHKYFFSYRFVECNIKLSRTKKAINVLTNAYVTKSAETNSGETKSINNKANCIRFFYGQQAQT